MVQLTIDKVSPSVAEIPLGVKAVQKKLPIRGFISFFNKFFENLLGGGVEVLFHPPSCLTTTPVCIYGST